MPNDQPANPNTHTLLNRVYLRPESGPTARFTLAHVQLRGADLLALAAELDEAVCDEQAKTELREYIAAIEFIAAELQAICLRYELVREKWIIEE